MPGGVEGGEGDELVIEAWGGGGGGRNGDVGEGEGDGEVVEDGGEGMDILAAFFWLSIFSLYAAFSSSTSLRPCLDKHQSQLRQ